MSPSTSCDSLTERTTEHNAELAQPVSQLSEEKNDLRKHSYKDGRTHQMVSAGES